VPEEAARFDARAFWSGTITFGLVSIPVNLFPANRSRRVSLRMLSPEGVPLRRRYFDPESDRPLEPDALVRGYELPSGDYVPVSDEELEGLAPEKSRDIDLRRFVEAERIDPLYFERAYFLTPAGGSTKAYRLLAETMERTARAGIATFVMRGKEYLVAILAEDGILRAETLRFPDELRDPEEVPVPPPDAAPDTDVKRFERAIRKRTAKALAEDELQDRQARRILQLVEAKRKRGVDVVETDGGGGSGDEDEDGDDVIDLLEVIRRSLQQEDGGGRSRGGSGGRPRGRSGARPGGASRKRGARGGDDDLAALTRQELYERAQELDIPGRSGMTKAQLLAALRT
jgi:DNA end-binding protein Ku